MDDLKVVFYIVIAIGWVIYNNYKKFAETARKRDPSRPAEDVVERRQTQPQPTVQIPQPTTARTPRTLMPRKMPVHTPRPRQIKKSRLEPAFLKIGNQPEGGFTTPSKVVQFEEQESSTLSENPMLIEFRNAGFRAGFIWSEILKRPYT